MTVRCHHYVGPWEAAQVSLALEEALQPRQVCASITTSHLFPIDVAGCYGDHGGFSHKPREEGAHAQGGSVYPGTRTERPFVVNAELRHTESNPGRGEKAEGPDCRAGRLHLGSGPPARGSGVQLWAEASSARSPGLGHLPAGHAPHREPAAPPAPPPNGAGFHGEGADGRPFPRRPGAIAGAR